MLESYVLVIAFDNFFETLEPASGDIFKQIIENYKKISEQMKKNILPTKEMFIKNLTKELTSNI